MLEVLALGKSLSLQVSSSQDFVRIKWGSPVYIPLCYLEERNNNSFGWSSRSSDDLWKRLLHISYTFGIMVLNVDLANGAHLCGDISLEEESGSGKFGMIFLPFAPRVLVFSWFMFVHIPVTFNTDVCIKLDGSGEVGRSREESWTCHPQLLFLAKLSAQSEG